MNSKYICATAYKGPSEHKSVRESSHGKIIRQFQEQSYRTSSCKTERSSRRPGSLQTRGFHALPYSYTGVEYGPLDVLPSEIRP